MVEHFTLEDPRDGVQSDVRVRADKHGGIPDIGRAEVVDETPGADGASLAAGQ